MPVRPRCPYCGEKLEVGTAKPEDVQADHITDEHQEMMPKVSCDWGGTHV